jgi:hypothetical protein
MRNVPARAGTTRREGFPLSLPLPFVVLLVVLTVAPAGARDRGADGHFEKRESSHFVLYQDVDIDRTSGFHGSRRFENRVLEILEKGYDELDDLLGLRPERRIQVTIYDPRIFDAYFAGQFRFAAAGFYNGTIYIRGDTELRTRLIRTLYHELVHAAFEAEAPGLVLPAWLNEGVAEWFEARAIGKRRLSGPENAALEAVAGQGQLFTLWQLSAPSFGHMGSESARLAYLQSYAFIEHLSRRYGDASLRRLSSTLIRKGNLHRAIERTFRLDLEQLEKRFASEYGGSVGR